MPDHLSLFKAKPRLLSGASLRKLDKEADRLESVSPRRKAERFKLQFEGSDTESSDPDEGRNTRLANLNAVLNPTAKDIKRM